MCVLVSQLYLTLCDAMDYSLPSYSTHGILYTRLLEWVAIPGQGIFLTQGSKLGLPCIGRQILYHKRHLGAHQINMT